MSDMWFVEERVLDHWAPAVYHGEYPVEKRADSSRKFRTAPQKVQERHKGLSLDVLKDIYGVRQGA